MKARVNLTVEKDLLNEIKKFAADKNASVSAMFEEYIKTIVRPVKKKSLIDYIDTLQVPEIPKEKDLIAEYHKDMEDKYQYR